jgi:hypothetical protein
MLCKFALFLVPRSPPTSVVGRMCTRDRNFAPGRNDFMTLRTMLTWVYYLDMHGGSVPAANASRLPSYILWLLLEGMVQLAASRSTELLKLNTGELESIYLPFMSCTGTGYEAQCDCYYALRDVFGIKPRKGEDCRGEDRTGEKIQAWG